ncbi:hypothetical protein [Chryseobacterium sp. GP-SGM7]|uniref:hypothetical protein n=1 Tax=Chryseobacterium sp. GP-SGM7 TaxID=3411323 RepID=UPI003B92507A
MRNIILLLVILLLNSCANEYIQFTTKKLYVYDNEVNVKLVPKKKRTKVILSYYDTLIETNAPKRTRIFRIVHNKRIKIKKIDTLNNYQNIIDSFEKIDENLMKFPKEIIDSNGVAGISFVSGDAASVKIFHKKGNNKKVVLSNSGLLPEYGYFYTTSKMILEHANISIDSVNSFGEKRKIINEN